MPTLKRGCNLAADGEGSGRFEEIEFGREERIERSYTIKSISPCRIPAWSGARTIFTCQFHGRRCDEEYAFSQERSAMKWKK